MQDARVRSFLGLSAELAEEAQGAAGLLLGDDEGDIAFAGASDDWPAVRMLYGAATEFASRALTHRQRLRASAIIVFAAERLQLNLTHGQSVRRDGFFRPEAGQRPAADEFSEAILAAAIVDPEERKLVHYGALLANVACHEETDRALALLLARLSARLSWRQLLLLSLFSVSDRFDLRIEDYQNERRVTGPTVTALQEAHELERSGLLLQTNGVVMTLRDLIPGGLAPVGTGRSLYKRLNLNQIPDAELEPVAEVLR
jgi:hypothetical protein